MKAFWLVVRNRQTALLLLLTAWLEEIKKIISAQIVDFGRFHPLPEINKTITQIVDLSRFRPLPEFSEFRSGRWAKAASITLHLAAPDGPMGRGLPKLCWRDRKRHCCPAVTEHAPRGVQCRRPRPPGRCVAAAGAGVQDTAGV